MERVVFEKAAPVGRLPRQRQVWRFLALFAAFAAAAPARADDPGWVLTQKSLMFGDQYVYISQNGMKCYNPRVGFAFVTHAPDWQVTFYNEKTRVFYQSTVDKWTADMKGRGFGTNMQDSSWAKAPGTTMISGFKASEYRMTGVNTLHTGKNHATAVSKASYWVASDLSIPPQLSQMLSSAYGLPITQNVPLKLQYIDNGKSKVALDTYHAQKSGIPITYFTPPPGLTEVKSDAEVMMTAEQKQVMNDMAHSLDDSPPTLGGPNGTATSTASSGGQGTVNVGGMNLDKSKVQQFLNALKGNK